MAESKVSIFALGGLGEIGKNMYGIEYGDKIIIIDAGLKFPEDEMLGIDMVIPDITYLLDNKAKVKAIFLTHGHEDHIGGLPYILRQIQVPLYGGRLTLGLVRAKLEEHGLLNETKLNLVDEHSVVRLGELRVSFFRTTHSIPDSLGIVIDTPEGTIVHTGDFKFDMTPVGPPPSFAKMAELGEKGVLVLLSDSTNSEKPGFTLSERVVGETIDEIFHKAEGRVILATFASNVYRLQQVVEAAVHYNRKIAVVGRSMEKVFQIGQELGYIRIPKGVLVDLKEIDRLPKERVAIISTGSQGEPMAALTRMARGAHRTLQIIPGDTVIFSASPIPGNTLNVSRTIDQLFRAGAHVVYGSFLDIHASGHGGQEELKLMLNLLRPKYFVPIHGEYRMLKQHAKLAMQIGIPEENIFIMDNGDRLEVSRNQAAVTGKVPAGVVLIDGKGVGDVGNIVLRDRKILSQDGLIVVVLSINKRDLKIVAGPDLISRGFVYVRESEKLLNEATQLVKQEVEKLLEKKITQWSEIKAVITGTLNPFLFEKTKRKPMILPVIMEI
ncbi:ribonuclease J1 [Bacillaceae bacterium]